jgi:hypothetical protein
VVGVGSRVKRDSLTTPCRTLALHLTAYSLHSFLASASGSSSGLALGGVVQMVGVIPALRTDATRCHNCVICLG